MTSLIEHVRPRLTANRGDGESLRATPVYLFVGVVSGFAALYTGNNLLFLLTGVFGGILLGALAIGTQMLRGVRVERSLPEHVTEGTRSTLAYRVSNDKRYLPSLAVEVEEEGWPARALVPIVAAQDRTEVRASVTWPRRGLHRSPGISLACSAPLGIIAHRRRLATEGELLVWPRHNLRLRELSRSVRDAASGTKRSSASAHERGEYRSLRGYQPGDDVRDVHWAATARAGELITREYESPSPEHYWICLDLFAPAGEPELGEEAVRIAASLAARATERGERFGLAAGPVAIEPDSGAGHLAAALDALALADLTDDAELAGLPAGGGAAILVSASPARAGSAWQDTFTPEENGS